jgi:hypothetical protein
VDNTAGHTAGNTAGNTAGRRRLDLKAAAVELGVTSEAIRRRAKRGTLPSEKGEDGLLYVWVHDVSDGVHDVSDTGPHGVSDGGLHGVSDGGVHVGTHDQDQDQVPRLPEALLERFEDENGFLRQELERLHRELERKDAILLTMAQRIPELEAAPEPRESPQTSSDQQGNGTARTAHPENGGAEKPSWWRRFFGL